MAENKPQESKQKEKKPQGTKENKKSQQNGQGTREEAPNAETPAAEEEIIREGKEEVKPVKKNKPKKQDKEMADDKPQESERKGQKQKPEKGKKNKKDKEHSDAVLSEIQKGDKPERDGKKKGKKKEQMERSPTAEITNKVEGIDINKDTTPEPASEAAAGEAGETLAAEEKQEEDQEIADDKPHKSEQKRKKQKMKKENKKSEQKGQSTTEGAPTAETKGDSKVTAPEHSSEVAAGEAAETPAAEEEQEEESKTKMAANNDDVKKIAGAIKDLKIERDFDRLMKQIAKEFSDGSWTEIQYMYRNSEYFHLLVDNVMTKTVKDKTGTIRSPINGKLHGVFFCVTLYNGKTLPTISPYGSTRVIIPLNGLINSNTNLYFADFYCFKEGGNHYIVLVLAQNGSEADVFCQKNLKQLNWNDNYFFRKNEENVFEYKHEKGLWVELFYTESVDLKMIEGVEWKYGIKTIKDEFKDIEKYTSCQICNI